MLYTRKPVIVKAQQFDPTMKPWPPGIHPWDKEPVRPRDMSWGYVMVSGSRMHIRAGDWLVYGSGRVWVVEQDVFAELYQELPGSKEAAANMATYPLSASGTPISRAINDEGFLSELTAVIEMQGDKDIGWSGRMKAEGWHEQVDGTWTNDLTTLFPEVVSRLQANDKTPYELFGPRGVASERLALMRRVLEAREPVVTDAAATPNAS